MSSNLTASFHTYFMYNHILGTQVWSGLKSSPAPEIVKKNKFHAIIQMRYDIYCIPLSPEKAKEEKYH